MILQALVSYYEVLAGRNMISQPGWSPAKVSYALELNDNGEVENILYLNVPAKNGKKMIPQMMNVPVHPKLTSGVNASFLCNNSSYFLGIDEKGKPERAKDCFLASRKYHHELLDASDEPAAKALLRFFDSWDSDTLSAMVDPKKMSDIISGSNLVFLYHGQYIHDIPSIRHIWQQFYSSSDGELFPCLVTGETAPVAQLHPAIKGVPGAQSSGASLVSYNADAFCSFNRKQGENAPTSQYAAFAYGAALNYLISTQYNRIGDAVVLFWAENGVEQYRSLMSFSCWGKTPANYTAQDLQAVVKDIVLGRSSVFDSERIDPNMRFYLLGISPNAARLSVRFFLRNSFGEFLRNIDEHQKRLNIVPDTGQPIPLWKLLDETVNQNATDKTPSPNMSGETLRAILNNLPYPSTLLTGVQLRIRADHVIDRERAAIIKAYYLKKPHHDISKEALQVSLNPECTDAAYVLGRLFSVLENIQNSANPSINTTIRDKYFNSASATPSAVFPTLINLSQKHLKKIGGGLAVVLDQQLTDILGLLGNSFPKRMTLPQQGAFQLGYYHQTAVRYTKKEDKKS